MMPSVSEERGDADVRIAVFSDIHSNYHAFKACVDYVLEKGIDHFLLLGDYVSDCAYPQKTMNLLYELRANFKCWFIKGNREEYLINHRNGCEDGWTSPSTASGSLLYTYENLTREDLSFFENLKISGHMSIEGCPDFLFCHGSMEYSRGDLRPGSKEAIKTLESMTTDMLVCGHTHMQGINECNGKKIVNVGSVGIPWGYQGDAQFGILYGNTDGWDIELIQLSYDKETAVKELYESQLNEKANIWVKLVEATLLTGIDRSRDCLCKALQKCEEREGAAKWSNLSEAYWEEAAREMGYI